MSGLRRWGSHGEQVDAYIDESRLRLAEGPANLYIMVAVLLPRDAAFTIRERLRGLPPSGVERLHWRDDRPAVKRKHLELIAELHDSVGLGALETRARLARAKREEAGRVLCLAALAAGAHERGVDEMVIEARQGHQDLRDDRTLLRARNDGAFSADLRWRHDRPLNEPLLWLPDAVAGVTGRHMAGQAD